MISLETYSRNSIKILILRKQVHLNFTTISAQDLVQTGAVGFTLRQVKLNVPRDWCKRIFLSSLPCAGITAATSGTVLPSVNTDL